MVRIDENHANPVNPVREVPQKTANLFFNTLLTKEIEYGRFNFKGMGIVNYLRA